MCEMSIADVLFTHLPFSLFSIQSKVIQHATTHRLWDYVPSKYTGPPHYCVTQSWTSTDSFQDMVKSLADELAPSHGAPSAAGTTYVWLDMFALDHTCQRDCLLAEKAAEEAHAFCSKGQ